MLHPTSHVSNVSIADIIIDPEFQKLFPPPPDDVVEGMTTDIDKHGFSTPLIGCVWGGGKPVLGDGHTRLQIYRENAHALAPPEIVVYEFDTREAALAWAIGNQINRRNLSPNREAELRGILYNQRKRQDGGHGRANSSPAIQGENSENTGNSPEYHSDTPESGDAAQQVADETGGSVPTVKRNGAYAESLAKIEHVFPSAAADIRDGNLKVARSVVTKIGKLNDTDIVASIANLQDGRKFDDSGCSAKNKKQPSASIVQDALERPVPQHLTEQHGTAAAIQSAARDFDKIRRAVAELSERVGGEWIHTSEIVEGLGKLKGLLVGDRYFTECPKCQCDVDLKCSRCKGHAYLPFAMKGTLSDVEREWLAS